MMRTIKLGAGGAIVVAIWFALAGPAHACGGFFCQTDPVDQVAERIVFTVNDNDTVSSLIEIAYAGEAADFSWILPIPEPIAVDDIVVPDDGEAVFDELHRMTDVMFLEPNPSECAQALSAMRLDASTGMLAFRAADVEVFASGEVGPFGFDVIGAEDPAALLAWLRDNDYRVDEAMEPLIDVYVEQGSSFLAMRLLDGESAESISPIEITYPGTQPMIPLRLTAVAALPQMPIYVWIFADEQAVPENYEHFQINTAELTFSGFGFNDYTPLVQRRADAVGGRGFITEFAGPSDSFAFDDPYLVERAAEQSYLTRLFTYIDPDEMLIDPLFGFDADASDVSNVRDARALRGLYGCERGEALRGVFAGSDAMDAELINTQLRALTAARHDLEESGYYPADYAGSNVESASGPPQRSDDDGLPTAVVVTLAIAITLLAGAIARASFAISEGPSAKDTSA